MGRGRSKVSSGNSGNRTNAPTRANTPSGVSVEQFSAMSMDEKVNTINSIVSDSNITVPSYLDRSETSKVLYALGMNNKPTVVDDATLSSMSGIEIFRTVYEGDSMPPPSSQDIADQIRHGDYTQLSGVGGSAHGRALYFATDFNDSAGYGGGEKNALIMRSKINPSAKIAKETSLFGNNRNDPEFVNFAQKANVNTRDAMALYALSKGIDGWYSNSYTMIINRGAITMSSQNKSITTNGQNKRGGLKPGSAWARSWDTAMNMK